MDSYRSIGISAALGGGTGTMLAIALGQRWLPGAIIGILIGALVGGLSFRPSEVATTLWSVIRAKWRALAWSAGALAGLAGIVVLWMHWPHYATGTVATLLTLGVLFICWKHPAVVAHVVLWFTGKALVVVWGIGIFVVGATVLPLAVAWVMGDPDPEPFGNGILISMVSIVLLMGARGCGIWRIAQRDSRPLWQWALINWFLRLIDLDSEPAPTKDVPIIPPDWGSLRINGQYVRWLELRRLSRMTGEWTLFFAIPPLMLIGLSVTAVADIVVTSALALASSGRIAAMEGAFIGSTMGFAASRLGATPLPAVVIGVVVAAVSSIGLRRLRKMLDAKMEAVPA